ncbi:TadE/TadG family type IV pilus assembly protein [Arthrobacter psychrolactophilus]
MTPRNSERGASAVEFAFILPVLVLLVIGIMEFGYLFNQQISATNAAREGARFAAVHYTDPAYATPAAVTTGAKAAARNSAPSLSSSSTINVVYQAGGACSPGKNVTVTVLPPKAWLTGFLPSKLIAPVQITGVGVMQCGG